MLAIMTRLWLVLAVTLLGCRDNKPTVAPLKPAPVIADIIPAQVTPRGYRIGQIDGEGFDPKAPVKVYFGTTLSPRAAVVTKKRVQVEIPPGANGTEVEIRVEMEGYQPTTVPAKLKYEEGLEDPDHGQ
jgi:hypothetical protein